MSTSLNADAGQPVFLITHEFYPRRGGIATFAEEIARAAVRLGYDLEVWAQATPSGVEKDDWPFRVRRMPLKGTHDLSCRLRLARELFHHRRALRGATVYLPEPGPMLTLMLLHFLRAFRPRRLILTFHGSEILKFARAPWRRWLAGRLIRRANRISTLSHYTRQLLLSHFAGAEGKVLLTPGAIRSDLADTGPKPPAVAGRKLVVLTVGRLHPRKGQHCTLEALQRLPREQLERFEYWIAGSSGKGGYEERLRALAAKTPALAVRFLGDVPDAELAGIYARADIFALTSVNLDSSIEGFGLVYLEAAAHGLPVVAHEVGGVAEAVQDGVTGLLVPPDRPEQLTAAFEMLLNDAPLRAKFGGAGPAWARRHCWRDSAEALFNSGRDMS